MVLAISVFTHLREQAQFQWLEELARIVRPGGLVLATTHGQGAVCKSNPTDAWYSSWLARGFSDDRRDRALEGIVADREYYRASFHTVDYVRRQWSRYFEIVDVIEAFTHSFQDLVVLRRTSWGSHIPT